MHLDFSLRIFYSEIRCYKLIYFCMAKTKRAEPKYNPMKSNIIQMGVVIIIIAALVLAYTAGMMK